MPLHFCNIKLYVMLNFRRYILTPVLGAARVTIVADPSAEPRLANNILALIVRSDFTDRPRSSTGLASPEPTPTANGGSSFCETLGGLFFWNELYFAPGGFEAMMSMSSDPTGFLRFAKS
jgi:hypothetical protein